MFYQMKKNRLGAEIWKRLLALLMSGCMLFGSADFTAFAEETEAEEPPVLISAPETPEAPFSQATVVDGVGFAIDAEAGVVAPGAGVFIEWILDDDFEGRVNETLALDPADEDMFFYHNAFRLSGAPIKGEARVRMDGLGFADWAAQYPGACLSVYAAYRAPDEAGESRIQKIRLQI